LLTRGEVPREAGRRPARPRAPVSGLPANPGACG